MLSINKRPVITLISLFSIDLGIRYISSFLRSHGFITYIIFFGQLRITPEITSNNYILTKPIRHKVYPDKNDVNLLINLLLGLKPDLIGISVSSSCFIIARVLTSKIKERLNIPVIWGGIHPTLCPEECIPYTDMVCIGEGEYPMLEVVQKLENKQPLTGIKNLWIKHQDGSIEKNPLRELILNLDSLPYPDFVDYGNKYLIDKTKLIRVSPINASYLKSAYSITSSRGCPFLCSYCCNSVLKSIYDNKGDYVRRRSVENVINELEYIRENREITMIKFWDDVFTYDEDWIAKFVELYRKKIALPFTCYTHPEYTHKNIIKMLRDAGLVIIDIGIQSGSQEFCRDKFKRYQSNEKIIEFAYFLKELGVKPRYNLIMDNPLEDDEDFNNTFELMLKLPRPYSVILFSLCYFPKVEFTLELLKRGIIREEDVEGRNYKALNNFFVYLDLVKDKKMLFRDTLMAMVVSGLWSERFIRKCKNSKFFKMNSKLLVIYLRLSLKLGIFSPVMIYRSIVELILKNKINKYFSSVLFNKYKSHPVLFYSLIKSHFFLIQWLLKNNIYIYYIILDHYEKIFNTINDQYLLENKSGAELLLFLTDNFYDNHNYILLKIKFNEISDDKVIDFYIVMCTLEKGLLTIWRIDFMLDSQSSDIIIKFYYPEIYFILRGIIKKAKLIYLRNDIYEYRAGPFLVSFLMYDNSLKRYAVKNNIIIYNINTNDL